MSPALFSRGELLIIVDSPVWLQELNFYKEDIMNKLNFYGVGAIRFRLGRVSSTNVKSEIRSRQPKVKRITDTEHAFIQEAVAKVPDEGLKETLKAAMEKAFTSGKTKIS